MVIHYGPLKKKKMVIMNNQLHNKQNHKITEIYHIILLGYMIMPTIYQVTGCTNRPV